MRLCNGCAAGEGHAEQVVPADALLLAGTAIVEEAVLTGKLRAEVVWDRTADGSEYRVPYSMTSAAAAGALSTIAPGCASGPTPEHALHFCCAGESTPQWKNPLGTPEDEAAEEQTLNGQCVPVHNPFSLSANSVRQQSSSIWS